MKKIAGALLLAAAFASSAGAAGVRARPVEIISYETQPCFFGCAIFRVTVSSDGRGVFEGRRRTAVIGTRRFTVTQAQFRSFAERLAPFRPAAGEVRYDGPPRCAEMATDQDSVEIVWRGAGEQRLFVYYGCDMETNRALFERLMSAPALLPIGDFIHRRR